MKIAATGGSTSTTAMIAPPSATNSAASCAVDDCPTTPSKSLERTSAGAIIAVVAPAKNADGITPSSSGGKGGGGVGTLASSAAAALDSLPRAAQFATLALCVFFFFGIHNVIQESMVSTPGFTYGVMLGWMEVLGVTVCSAIERSSLPYVGNGESRARRRAPWEAYPPLTVCLLMSSSLASWSLDYINFPTKVVFRSCKLLPTMVLAYVMGNAKRFTAVEVGSAVAVCAGLITFAAGDWSLSKPQFHPFGLTLVTLSVFADAVLPNAQERLFRKYDASKSEVMFYTNIYTLVAQTVSAFLSGDMMGMFHFVLGRKRVHEANYFYEMTGTNTTTDSAEGSDAGSSDAVAGNDAWDGEQEHVRYRFILVMVAYIFISWIAVSAHTAVVKKFGGVAAVFVGTARKGMTLILSFVLFPKEGNWKYAVGAVLVLGGLTVASLEKQKNKRSVKIIRKTSEVVSDHAIASCPALPYTSGRNESEGCGNGNGDARIERQPLLDVEMGKKAPSSANVTIPERRR